MSPFGSKHSLSRRVFGTVFVVAAIAIVVFTVAGTAFLQSNLARVTRDELYDEVEIVANVLNESDDDVETLSALDLAGKRFTLIDPDGSVVFDSEEPASQMENHADREEFAEALDGGHGSSSRASSTIGEVMLYEAVRLDDGRVVRLAQAQDGFLSILAGFVGPLVVIAAVVIVASFIAARRESRAIIAPLLDVDLDHPRHNMDEAYSEMVPMLERIESQRQELKRQVKVLADNDRMRREFTANITHELKTPLTAISGYAELISGDMEVDEADVKDFAGRIHREAQRLTALVNDILTLSNLDEAERSDAGDSAGALGSSEPVDLPRLVDTIAQRLEQLAVRNGVSISCDASPSMVIGVPRLLDELVEDTGIGIAPEEQQKIFERFYRVDKSRSKARGGTGLGLAIVKHAAAFHHAEIDLESELGRGTTITVTFPVQAWPMEGRFQDLSARLL